MKNRFLTSILIALTATLAIPAGAPAQTHFAESHTMRCITMNEGLSHNFVDDIFRDSRGFVWIATSGSLARYDGYEFINFTPNSLKGYIKSTFVRKVAEDRFGRLWIVSDGGIDVIDIHTLAHVEPTDLTGRFASIANIPTGYVEPDARGDLWLRDNTDIVCLRFDDDGNIAEVAKLPCGSESVNPTSAIRRIGDGPDGMWGVYSGGVCRLECKDGKITAKPIVPGLTWSDDLYVSDMVRQGGHVWIATDAGLLRYDPVSRDVKTYHSGAGEGSLSQNFITSLAVTPQGHLICGSLNGLNIYDEGTDTFSQTSTGLFAESFSLSSNFVNCLMTEGDNLWVGTEGCGVNIVSPKKIFARTIRHNRQDPASLSPNPVNSIYEDSDGTVWVGTVEGGLNRAIGGVRNGFTHFRTDNGTLTHNTVSAITGDRDGNLWVGTWGGGVNVLSRTDPVRLQHTINVTDDGRHRLDYVGIIIHDPYNNAMWIGANTGLYIYYKETGRVELPYPEASDMKGSVAALVSTDGKLWVGGLSGLDMIDLKRHPGGGFNVRHHRYKLDHPETKGLEKVISLMLSHDGTLWVGTNGNGIYRRETEGDTERFVNYSTADGLPNDIAHGLAEDPHGNVWVATYHGLACRRTDGGIVSFDRHSGLGTEQFYWNASTRLANGDILFGSVDGLLEVKGLAPADKGKARTVVFTSLTTDGETVYDMGGSHSIPESEKSLEVAFSALDFAGEQGRFVYRLTGFDNSWKELPPGRNNVVYTNLSPGDYSLEVKYAAPGQSAHSAPVSSFGITILPHFYKTWWFMLLVALAVIAAIWAVYRWRVKDLTRQRDRLRKAVHRSVAEISQQKSVIEEHARELTGQNVELKRSNEQIRMQKDQLSEANRTIQKMTVDRLSFFTNITHEFRTPITLIIGPIERALKLSSNPKVIEQLNFVERNSKYLLSLVNQLMDFRKVESGKMEILPRRKNFRDFIDGLVPPFRVYAEERGIELRTLIHIPADTFSYDEDALRKVLTNLLGNAIKFTPDNGRVTLYAALFRSSRCEHANTLYMSVSDTGNGIAEEEIGKVFDRFYQGKSQIKYPLIGASDSGIGLYLCRNIIEVYGGTISVRNNRGAGCTFRVTVGVPDNDIELNPAQTALLPAPQAAGAAVTPEGDRVTVLVVEDNADMRAFIRSILSDDYNVVTADNGAEGLQVLQGQPVDFIVSDLMMPVMDGIELSRRVKENFAISHIPILMLTAKTADETRLESYRTGVDGFLQKPFDEEILLARIKGILDNKRRYQRKFIAEMNPVELNISEESGDKKFVDKVMEVMKANYQNSYFEVGDFAEELGVSKSLLNKKLQSLVGESPNQFLRSYRLKVARGLLEKNRTTREMNISEIAFEVGFNDSKYFTRCFTKQFGVNPSSILRD